MTALKKSAPAWPLLRRRDQLLIAVAVALSLTALGGHSCYCRLLGRSLVDVDRVPRQQARYSVDMNRAEWQEWTLLPGIGETLARRIVESREREGPFRSQEDLLRVRGIGPRNLERMRPYLLPLDELQ